MAVTKITGAGLGLPNADGNALGGASNEWSDLYLADSSVIYFGNDQDVTITHDPDDGLFFKSIATTDDNPLLLTLQTGETTMVADEPIAQIHFQAPDEASGTDAILVCAGIEAVAEEAFSASSNATKLRFKTASTAVAAETMFLGSDGALQVSDEVSAESFNLPITLNGTDGSSTHAGDNIILDASASGVDAGERLLYEGIPPDEVSVANLAAGTDGHIITFNADGYPTTVGPGTDGQVLTSTGAGSPPAFETASAGWTLGTPTATTSGTSVSFSGIASGTSMIILSWTSGSVADGDDLYCQIGDSGGIETSAYQGDTGNADKGPTAILIDASAGTPSMIATGFPIGVKDGGGYINGHLTLTLLNSSTNTWSCSHMLEQDSGTISIGAGSKALSGELTQLTIAGNTFDLGQANIIYL